MTVIEMAKAHLQNVNQRIDELTKQQQLIQSEIDNLRTYLTNGLKDIEASEENK